MKVLCPHCHQSVTVNGLGRPRLAMPVINVYDALHRYKTITAAAKSLGVSRAYVYNILKNYPIQEVKL